MFIQGATFIPDSRVCMIWDILKLQKCSKVSLLLSTEWWYLRRSKRKRGARFKWIRQAGTQ